MPDLKNFYITFGSDPEFPFQNTFMIIRSTSELKVRALYPLIHPCRRPGDNTLNFSFCYSEDEWLGYDGKEPVNRYYSNQEPAEIIIDTLNGDYVKMPLKALNRLKNYETLSDTDRDDIMAYLTTVGANFAY